MQIGVSDTVGPGRQIRAQAEATARHDYDAFWTQELVDTKDGLTTAAAIAAMDLDLDIVVGLPSPYVRHPALIATELRSVEDFSDGRVTGFVTGTNVPEVLRKLGEDLHRPIKTMSEAHDVIRALIRENRVDYDGEIFELTNWKLRSTFENDIPMFLAGMGPKMRELAAYKYDGLFLPFNTPIPFVEEVAATARDALVGFDRDPADFTIALNIPTVAVDEDADLSREDQIREVLEFTAWHCCSDHIQPLVAQAGIEYDIEALREAVRANDYDAMRAIVDDDFLETVAVVGTPEECRARYEAYVDAGLDYPVIYNYGKESVKLANVEALAPESF